MYMDSWNEQSAISSVLFFYSLQEVLGKLTIPTRDFQGLYNIPCIQRNVWVGIRKKRHHLLVMTGACFFFIY